MSIIKYKNMFQNWIKHVNEYINTFYMLRKIWGYEKQTTKVVQFKN